MDNTGKLDENGFYFRYIVKYRIALGFVGAALFLLFAKPTALTLLSGLPLVLLGEGIRTWASGVVVKKREICMVGPYSFMRNPLYLGSYIMATGLGVMSGSLIITAFILVVFPLVYDGVIRREEKHLIWIHGKVYLDYAARVPRWVPDFSQGMAGPVAFDAKRMFTRHKEWRAWLGLLAVAAFLAARAMKVIP